MLTRVIFRSIGALVLFLGLLATARPCAANGRFPRAERLLEDPRDQNHLLLAATYGLLVTHDRGRSWRYVCEAAFTDPDKETDSLVALSADGGVLISTYGNFALSRSDLCDFRETLGQAESDGIPDFTMDAQGVVLAAQASSMDGIQTNRLQESSDGGLNFHPLGAAMPEGLRVVSTVDVAPSDVDRIYVSGLGMDGSGILLRSDDRGQSFEVLPLPTDASANEIPFIAAVDPRNPDVLYVRTDIWKNQDASNVQVAGDALLVSNNGGHSFSEAIRVSGKIFGF